MEHVYEQKAACLLLLLNYCVITYIYLKYVYAWFYHIYLIRQNDVYIYLNTIKYSHIYSIIVHVLARAAP